MTDSVTKSDLIEKVAERVDISKRKSRRTIEAITNIITENLMTGDEGRKVTIHGFGTFDISHRKARKGVDPTDHDKEIEIPARTVPKFRPGSRLKRSVREAHDEE
ncbi:MAG: HU family DNA-binding protein [bacterium]